LIVTGLSAMVIFSTVAAEALEQNTQASRLAAMSSGVAEEGFTDD
jgi:hypothetical protein